MVPELAIQVEEPAELREAKEEMAKVQLELNLQISKLQLKAQPSTPPEIKEQRTSAITTTIAKVNNIVKDCTKLFEESFKVLTTLQEDPNIQRLDTEARRL